MDEQQEREFYERQKNMPRSNPNFGSTGIYALGPTFTSRSKTGRWFARMILIIVSTIFMGSIAMVVWDSINVLSSDTKEYSAPK